MDHIKNGTLNMDSVKAFLEHLIDYAGLFPPSSLPLKDAISNYVKYIRSHDSWILGLFVIPSTLLDELERYMDLFDEQFPLALSVLGRKEDDMKKCIENLTRDLNHISCFQKRHGNKMEICAFELPLPPQVPILDDLKRISTLASNNNLKIFCEFTVPLNSKEWDKSLSESLDAVAEHNIMHNQSIGMKLRTGGVTAEMFPAPEQVAAFIIGCRDRKIPLKFTAGLHHPIRMYRSEVKTKMHGFLNVFFASILAYSCNLNRETLINILSDEQHRNFFFDRNGLGWKEYRATTNEVRILRNSFLHSYGCCSFDEPRDELRELDIFEEGVY
jgi:hypothetical protein